MDTDKTFSLISYKRDSYNHKDDEQEHSDIHFADGLTLAQIDELICKQKSYEDEEEWQFLILHQGRPMASRGEAFAYDTLEGGSEDDKEIAAVLESTFRGAQIKSETEKRAAQELAERKRQEEAEAYRKRCDAQRYYEAQETIKKYEAKNGKGI